MFVRERLLRGQHRHEFEFNADVVLAFGRVRRHLQSERGVKGPEIRESVRLKQWVGLDIAVFDFVHRTIPPHGVAKAGHVG